MKNRFIFLITLVCMSQFIYAQQHRIRVMTYNIKYDDKNDKVNNWELRKDEVVGLIRYHKPGLMGTQEGLVNQLDYIQSGLGYQYIGIGRDGGKGKGEYSAIFYDQNQFKLEESGTFWLADSPENRSKSWDAALPRICTWGLFVHSPSGKLILFFNTHFDHVGEQARAQSAELILREIRKKKEQNPEAQVILSGDFNFTPDAIPYQVLTGVLYDTQKLSLDPHYGPQATFNGFHFDQVPERRIDYIFVEEQTRVLIHATLSDSKNRKYPSDHFPVLVELEIQQ